MISLFIVPSKDGSLDFEKMGKIADTFTNQPYEVHFLNTIEQLDKMEIKTDWYMFMFDNEMLSEQLKQAIPFFLLYPYDFYIIYKRVKMGGRAKFFFEPRIFHFDVRRNNLEGKKHETILDGWLEEEDRWEY